MRWTEWLPTRRRRTGLHGVQWNLDDFNSMEEALSVADALTEAGIYSVVTETETGPNRPHRIDHDKSTVADLQTRAYRHRPDPGVTDQSHEGGQARVEPGGVPHEAQEGRSATQS